MQVIKKSRQKFRNNSNRMPSDYEIRTFTGNQRTPSPIELFPQNIRRSPNRINEQGIQESALGEMIYLEPNETTFRRGRNMSPLNDGHNIIVRSPGEPIRNENYSGGVVNMARRINFSNNPQYQQTNYEENREISRSPKAINIGESPQDMEYNIKTFNKRINKKKVGFISPQNNNLGDRSYHMILNDTGNIFLDQPMQQAYNQQNDVFNSSGGMIPDQRGFEPNSREIQYGMVPRDLQEPLPHVLRKMSPKGNVEGDSDSISEKNDNVNGIRDLKSQLDKNINVMFKNEDGIGIGDKNMQNRGDMENLEIMEKAREGKDNVTGDDVKKLIKYYVKTYDPHKGEDGNLISNSQTIILSNQDKLFNDRYKVLQKMNKLSNILLAKKRTGSADSSPLNRSYGEDMKNKFDKGNFNKASVEKTRRPNRSVGKDKFLYVSLAILSAKGPNTEDRIILRKMRLDKGGVVDLAQEALQKKSKFKIKKARAGGRGITSMNPKYREKAAKIVQAWWRERKAKYKKILDQIIKIQSIWRGKFTRRYIYDVIYISYLQEKFLSIMRNVLVNYVRPIVFDELFSKNKLIKDKLRELLLRYDSRFTILRIRPYFLKWKNTSDVLSNRILKSKELFYKKLKKENKLTLLKKYFEKWVLMSNLYKYIGKAKNADEKKQKFFGTLNMVNGLSNLSKRQIFKNTKGPICNYLKDLLKQKLLIKIIKKICKKCLELKIKNYLNNWRINAEKKKLEDFKKEVFLRTINHIDSRLDKIKIRYYLNKWRKHIQQGKKILEIKEGGDLLKNFIIKQTLNYPLKAFAEKCDNNNLREKLLKLLSIKQRNLKEELRKYFDKWSNKKLRLDDKDKRNELYITLLKNLINKINKRILHNRFNQWRAKPQIDIKDEMKKINSFVNKLYDVYKKHYNDDFKDFLIKLDKTRDKHSLENAANKIFKICNNKRKVILRYYLFKWRSQAKNDELNELHRQLLKYIITTLNAKNNRNRLGKYFTRWRLFVGENKNYDNLEKLKLVLKGGDLLDYLYKKRLRYVLYKLYKKLGKDYRPIILGKLIKNIDMPKSTLRECFNRWKEIIDKDKINKKISTFKAKIMNINIDKIKKRNDREKLIKAFFHWKSMTKKPEEYYPKINNLLNSITKYIKKKVTEEPFDKIKMTVNPTRYLLNIIKNYDNQEQRLLNGKLRNLLGRWRKASSDIHGKNLKARLIYNIKTNLDESQKKKLLLKYLTKWRLNCRKKGLNLDFIKGIDKLTETFKAPIKQKIYDAFMNKIKNEQKQKNVNDLVQAINNHKNNILHKIFMSLWKKSITTDPNKITKIKTKLRKIIKYNEMEPLIKAFRKWVKLVENSKLRDKDMLHAAKILFGILTQKNKMNVYHAFNDLRYKIHLLREQYLKALLIKQIKSAQNIKSKMSDEARLRSALLKWRTNLISINYLNTLKKIRKGCKLFKLGLKKLHERDILNNIKNLSKDNKKNNILKKIIIKLIPDLEKQKMKTYLDIWKNKLNDTQRMKNKMKNLLDDYIYSDKIHQDLFNKPKNEIVNLFKNYDDKKKEAAQKITKFVQGMLVIPEHMRKMIITKKLYSIIKKKNDHINDIKKINFIRFYRQTQKLRNHQYATFIQKFIKKKLKKIHNKKDSIKKGLNIFDTFIKRQCFDSIKDVSNKKFINTILKKIFIKNEEDNNKLLKDKFKQWRDKIPLMKNLDSLIKIQNTFRKYLANKNLKNLKLRNTLLKKIHENNEKKNNIKLMAVLRDWLHRALKMKNNDAATLIQREYRKKMKEYKKKMAEDKLKNLFKNNFKHKLANILDKLSRIMGGKGLVIYKALQDCLYRNPYDKLINNLKLIGRIKYLKKIQPKIHNSLRKYYIPKALKKWKENTYDQTIKNVAIIQKFLRDQHAKKMEQNKERREFLLYQIFYNKMKNDTFKLKLPLNIWKRKVKLEKINEAATLIQNKFREKLANNKKKELKTIKKYIRLINNIKKKTCIDILKKIKNKKDNQEKRKKSLKITLSKKIFLNNKTNLRNYFNRWRDVIKKMNDNSTHISKAFRRYKAIREKKRLKKMNELLKKYFIKHEKIDIKNVLSKIRKWKNKTKLTKLNDKIIIIQRFVRPILAKIRNEKFKKYFNDNSKNKIIKSLLLAGKFNKLQHALNKPKLNRFMNNLQKIKKNKNRNYQLSKTIKKTNDKIKKVLLLKFIKRWKDNSKRIAVKKNDSAALIQRVFKGYKARKEKNRLLFIKKLIRSFILKKDNLINNNLYHALRKWAANVRGLICNENALKIQKMWRKFLDKINKDKELARKLKIQKGLEKLLNIKFGSKYVIDKIKSENNRNIFNQFNDMLKAKRYDILKDCFDKIKKRAFDNVLRKAMKIPESFKKRIIKKFIFVLKDKANKLGKKRAVEKISKNWKIYLNNKKLKNREELLKKILSDLIQKKSNTLKNYCNKWNDIAKKMKIQYSQQRIGKFLENRFKIANVRNNWDVLSNKLNTKNRNLNILDIMKKLKQMKLLNKFKKPFINIARKKFFNEMKNNKKRNIIYIKYTKLLSKRNNKNNNDILRHYLSKWNDKTHKLNDREDKLENALDILDKKQIINDVDIINKVMVLKKLYHDLPLVRAKYFIQKIKENADKKNKYNKLTEDILKSKNYLDIQKKEQLMDKLYKLYYYNKINGLVDAFNKYDNKLKNFFANELLLKLMSIKSEFSTYNYNNKQELTNKAKILKMKFKKKVEKNEKILTDQYASMRAILPNLVGYIQRLINRRKEDAFDKVKNELINRNFTKLFKAFNNKIIEPYEKEYIKKIKRESKFSETRPIYQTKLFQLFRKKYIKIFRTTLVQPSRLYKLFYLVNITKMHTNIAAQRYYREVIRKWRFVSFTKKMARKKLELMYKNLHASYLQMADEIFGDDKINPSVFKEFEKFGSNVGMFTGQEPEVDEELNKKYYSAIDKKYVFTKRASRIISDVEDVKKDEFVEEMNEGYDANEGEIRRSATQSSKIKQQFDSLKKKGLSTKDYFTKK